MIKGKFNLAALTHAIMPVKRKDGTSVKAIVIPIEDNSLFLSDKGNVYLDWIAREIPADKRKGDDSHLLSQSLKKEDYEKLKAAGKYPPTIGNMREESYEPATAATDDLVQDAPVEMPF